MIDRLANLVIDGVGEQDCLVALGGGADSAVLLWAAVEALGSRRVRGVFVYQGLESSSALRTAATAVAASVGVRCDVIDGVVPQGGNLEARARTARYAALESLITDREVGLSGHTADDQVETALMRFVRGSGAGAIGGIPPERGVWQRPLLDVSRAELRSKAEELVLPFIDDPDNANPRFVRPRIRHNILPVIESELGPGVKSLIRKSALLLANDDAFIEAESLHIPAIQIVGGISIPTAPLITAPLPVASRAVRRSLRVLLDGDPGTSSDVDAVLFVARGAPSVSLSGALQVVAEPPFVTIHRNEALDIPTSLRVRIGETFAWCGAEYTLESREKAPPLLPGGRFTVLASTALPHVLSIRGVEPGDRIDIEVGSTPVSELLRAAGVPSRERANSLVLEADGRIAAIGTVRVAAWARPRHGERVVVIEREATG